MQINLQSKASCSHNMTVEGRKLCATDLFFFQNGYSLKGWFSFVCPTLTQRTSSQKWKDSFRRVVEVTPILQTEVVTNVDDDTLTFAKNPESEWPTIQIHNVKDDVSAIQEAKEKIAFGLKTIQQGGEKACRETSLILIVILGLKRVVMASVAPHHFLDGQGASTVGMKTLAYARLPKFMWPLLDRMSSQQVPNFLEMAMKKDIGVLQSMVNNQKNEDEKETFKFREHDPMADGAINNLYGFNGDLLQIPARSMKKYRSELRKAGISISTAFMALPLKVFSILLERNQISVPEESLIKINIVVDARRLGSWDRSAHRSRKIALPAVANYAFSLDVPVPSIMARTSSLEGIAKHLKSNITRLENDVDFRAHHIFKSCQPVFPDMFIGASSMVVPSITSALGFRDAELDATIDFGPIPHVWFYVITVNKVTTKVVVDVKLPVEGLDEAQIRAAIQEAVKDSALETIVKP